LLKIHFVPRGDNGPLKVKKILPIGLTSSFATRGSVLVATSFFFFFIVTWFSSKAFLELPHTNVRKEFEPK